MLARVALGLVVASLGCVLASPAAASGRGPALTSISPASAARGELVEVTGRELSAGNLTVTVDGIPVRLESRRGTRASFRVPVLAGPGPVEVVARKSGGKEARIGLEIRFDGETSAVADEAAAVSTAVGPQGGSIEVQGMRLSVPEGAVPEGTTITATPLVALAGSPFAGDPVGLKLEPSGLVLMQPATLTLPRPAGLVAGFGFDGDGDGFHLVPHRLAGETVEVKVWHFSGAGVLPARLDELQAALSYEPAPAHQRAEQRIAAALLDAQVNDTDPGVAIAAALRDWRLGSVVRGLEVARTEARVDFFELAFGEWLAWLAYLQSYRDTLSPADASFFDSAATLDRGVAVDSAAAVAHRALARCVGPDLPRAALRDVLRVAGAVNLAELAIEAAEPVAGRTLPTGPDLPTACVDVRLLSVEHAAVLALDRDNRVTAGAHVAFWSGDPSTSIPLRYRLNDTTDGPPVSLATDVTTSGLFSATTRPRALGSRMLELSVGFATSDDVLLSFFERRNLPVEVRPRLVLQGRRVADAAFSDSVGPVAGGGRVILRVRLAGDDIAGQTIALAHDGGGTLAETATTGADGTATATYVAPSAAAVERVTATVVDAGLAAEDSLELTSTGPVSVSVSPATVTLAPGATQQFTASVTGAASTVTWTASGGTITAGGLFTAGSTPGTYSVTAHTATDPAVAAGAVVTVRSATSAVTGVYFGTQCFVLDDGSEHCTGTGTQIGFQCSSSTGVCGWFANAGPTATPNMATFCVIDTDVTAAGGSFTGRVSFCRFGISPRQAGMVIEGAIGDGQLVFTVRAPDLNTGGMRVVERWFGVLAVPIPPT